MKLPVDVKAVLEEAVDIEAARQIPLSVSVLVDDTAPIDVTAHVRSLFASAASHARITVGYLDSIAFSPNAEDDMAVIIAGVNESVGAVAARIREAGVPVMVTTTMPEQVAMLAEQSGYAIPLGDLVSPDITVEGHARAAEAFDAFFGKIATPDAIEMTVDENSAEMEPAEMGAGETGLAAIASPLARVAAFGKRAKRLDLDKFLKKAPEKPEKPAMPELLAEDAVRAFNTRMGEWIIETCREKRLSFALAFPFVARPLSLEAVNATAVQNAGVGVVIVLPGADMPIMTLNQAKMILQIAAAYGQPMTVDRVKELAAVVGGAFAFRTAARNVAGLVPGLGWAVKGAVGYSGTLVMGHAAIEYFENGGGVMGVAGTVSRVKEALSKAVSLAKGAPEPSEESSPSRNEQAAQTAKELGGMAVSLAGTAAKAAGPLARSLAHGAAQSFAAGIKTMMKK